MSFVTPPGPKKFFTSSAGFDKAGDSITLTSLLISILIWLYLWFLCGKVLC